MNVQKAVRVRESRGLRRTEKRDIRRACRRVRSSRADGVLDTSLAYLPCEIGRKSSFVEVRRTVVRWRNNRSRSSGSGSLLRGAYCSRMNADDGMVSGCLLRFRRDNILRESDTDVPRSNVRFVPGVREYRESRSYRIYRRRCTRTRISIRYGRTRLAVNL